MFEGLQKKWKVSSKRLVLILITFAVGGSLTGYVGKKLMSLMGIMNPSIYIPVYIVLITLIWPIMVLLISVPMGQFYFFKTYIAKLGRRIGIGYEKQERSQSTVNKPQSNHLFHSNSTQKTSSNESAEMKSENFKRIIIFASGAGSNAQNIIDHFRNSFTVRIVSIICNKAGAGVVEIARRENIPVLMIEKDRFFKGDGYLPEIKKVQPDLVVLAGFLWKIPEDIISAFRSRIVNIHPALLPKYGGKGMYGQFVHAAVIKAGEHSSGITIHYVDEEYDNGDVILQVECPVLEGDTPEKLAARIHQIEHRHYPHVIERVLEENYL